MTDERIHVLRDILLELHHGASPESVQERFDAILIKYPEGHEFVRLSLV